MLRLDQLIGDLPEIKEMEVNPLMAGPERDAFAAVDVRIHLHPDMSHVEQEPS
jgi:hypothetical protein